jgi:hypothetical protein
MAPNIPSKHHGIRLNLHTELAKQFQKHPNNRAGNHDHLGINKHQTRIESYARGTQPKTDSAREPQRTMGGAREPQRTMGGAREPQRTTG